MDGQLDSHVINHLESKFKDSRFVRVDSEVVEKLIEKDEVIESKLSAVEQENINSIFTSQLSTSDHFVVVAESMNESDAPVMITQSEFMRRMKDMSQLGGGGMNFYGDLPDSYNLVVNNNHPIIIELSGNLGEELGEKLTSHNKKIDKVKADKEKEEKAQSAKKEEEVTQAEKDKLEKLDKNATKYEEAKKSDLSAFADKTPIVKQLIDLALLSNNMLKGEELNKFVKRSIELL